MTRRYMELRVCERFGWHPREMEGYSAAERRRLCDFETLRLSEERRRDETMVRAVAEAIAGLMGGAKARG